MTAAPFIAALALATATSAQPSSELQTGFAGALRGCEEWVLNPASWTNGVAPFISAVGLGNKMGLVDHVDEATLPPEELRRGDHYWRINSTDDAGYILIVSDQLPMCHITGGGNADLEPVVEAVLASPDFRKRWEPIADHSRADMRSTEYRSREDARFSIEISRAKLPGERLDRVQVLATAIYKASK